MFKRFLNISYRLVTVRERGFNVKSREMKDHLETIGTAFLDGYHAVTHYPDDFIKKLEEISPLYKGFAYEGAGMALILLDHFSLFKKQRFHSLLLKDGRKHKYMLHVGAGWAYAKFPIFFKREFSNHDELLKWLIVDGIGFYHGYFKWEKYVNQKKIPRIMKQSGYMKRAYFQGLGRSLWFVKGSDILAIANTINSFPLENRSDLWSGVGLGSAYAGEINIESINFLKKLTGDHFPSFAQGVAFGVTARYEADIPSAYTEMMSFCVCGTNPQKLSELTSNALQDARKVNNDLPLYENWRNLIQVNFNKGAL